MRFSIRQLLLVMTCLAVWLAFVIHAHLRYGVLGDVPLGLLSAITLLLSFRITMRWSQASLAQRSMLLLAAAVSVAAVLFMLQVVRRTVGEI